MLIHSRSFTQSPNPTHKYSHIFTHSFMLVGEQEPARKPMNPIFYHSPLTHSPLQRATWDLRGMQGSSGLSSGYYIHGQDALDFGSLLLALSVIDSQSSIFPSVTWEQSPALLPPPSARMEGGRRTQDYWVWYHGGWGQISNLLIFPQQITNIY